MYCVSCGAALRPGEAFCGSCGRATAPARPAAPANRVSSNRRLLGILWLAISALRLVPGIVLLVIFGGGGPLPGDFPNLPVFVLGIIQIAAYCFLAFATFGLLAGWGLLTSEPWSRMLAIVLGFLNLIEVPFGTALGIYTLWVLLPAESEAEFRQLTSAA